MASPMSFANIYYKQTVDINALYVNINKYFTFVMHVNTSLWAKTRKKGVIWNVCFGGCTIIPQSRLTRTVRGINQQFRHSGLEIQIF